MKVIVLFTCLILSHSTFAKTVARVIDVKGNAFTFSPSSSSHTLRYGSKIEDLSEVMVEDGSAVSLINNQGHVYHVSSGTLVKFYSGFAEVKNGQIWVVAKDTNFQGAVHTSNSIAKYKDGQFIYSFDNTSGKTQLLVLSGDVAFSNALEPELSIGVPEGYFSLVEQNFERGLPRTPTKVGLNSYKNFKTLFANFDNLQDTAIEKSLWGKPEEKRSRSIASVAVADQFAMNGAKAKSGRIIKITTYKSEGRLPASIGPMNYYKEIKNKEANLRKPASTGNSVKIKYWGFDWKTKAKPVPKPMPVQKMEIVKPVIQTTKVKKINNPLEQVNRKPASVDTQNLVRELSGTSVFEKSLEDNSALERRHSDEVNSLIDDLKSYQQDYKKNY